MLTVIQKVFLLIFADVMYALFRSRHDKCRELEQLPRASTQVVSLAAAGRKIQAIKVYRQENPGIRLKEAKSFIDAQQELTGQES